jgi:hypothetical protein
MPKTVFDKLDYFTLTPTLMEVFLLFNTHKALFKCSRIHINPHVLRWIGVKFKLNSIPIYTNTYELK